MVKSPAQIGEGMTVWTTTPEVTAQQRECTGAILGAMGREVTVDVEACAYLYTVSLTQSMGHDWTQIYLYVAGRAYGRWNKGNMPEDIKVESLTTDQMRELNRPKEWLNLKRTLAMQDGDQTERRERKEEEATRREAEQPALFGF